MRPRKIVLLIVCCLFLSGCWDHNEPERLLYINGLGIHYNEKGDVETYLQIINLQGLAKQESGGGPSAIKQSEVGHATGKTLEEAVFNLYHSVDRRMFWGHLSFVILSDAAVKKGAVKDISDFIDRFRETRYRTYFFVTKDSIQDVMLATPLDNIPLAFSKLSDPIDNYKQTSYIEPINLRELIIHTDEPSHQVHLPVLKLTEQWANEKEKKKSLLMEEIAIVSDNTLIAILPKDITLGIRGMNKNFVRDTVILNPRDHQRISVIVYDKDIKITPTTEPDGKTRFTIKIKVKANLQLAKFKLPKKEIEESVKHTIKSQIKRTYEYTRKRNIDVFDFSETLYRKDNKAWKKIQKGGRIPLEKDTIKSVKIDIKLQNTGRNNIQPLFEEEYNKGAKERYKNK